MPSGLARLIVIGGGCYGSYHARQLDRARQRGGIAPHEIVIVDREADCAARAEFDGRPGFRFVTSGWDDYLDDCFEALPPDTFDQVVPTPIAPHLMFHWLRRRAERRCAAAAVRVQALPELPPTPYAGSGADGSGYLSFATWTCPVTCYEPATCPATRGPKNWEMDDALFAYARRMRGVGHAFDLVEVFRIRHLAWGIAAFPARLAVAAAHRLDRLAQAGGGPRRLLVGTVSACHGIATALEFTPPEGSGRASEPGSGGRGAPGR